VHVSSVLAREVGARLAQNYADIFGTVRPEYADLLRTSARVVIERIAASDALYHDVEHTILVTMVGQAILQGRLIAEHTTPEDWVHFTIATLVHDIGYLRGICAGDGEGRYVIGSDGQTVELPRGASDAALAPYHVDRGKIFVRARFAPFETIDAERIARGIELTRFPVPMDNDHGDTAGEPGLVRAADLIGQLGDPHYPRKWKALFHEFEETGMAAQLGYATPADLAEGYPRFFWTCVSPYIQPAVAHLDRTSEGKLWLAQLYSHVFVEEHVRHRHGPERA
jgi:hypothetical protein